MPYGSDPTTPPRTSGYGKDPTSQPVGAVEGHAARDTGIEHPPDAESAGAAFRRGLGEGWGDQPPGQAFIEQTGPLGRALAQPFQTAIRGATALTRGAQEALSSTGRLGRDIAAMPEAVAGSPGGVMGHAAAPGAAAAGSEAMFPGAASAVARTPASKAADLVSKTFGKSVKGGETTALDAIDEISAARSSGQPLTISDVGGRAVKRLAGTVYRSGGEPAAHMEQFYKGRTTDVNLDHLSTAAGARIEKAIGEHIATGSYKQATQNLIAERSAHAQPLWEEATAGGSTAPLEKQFETVFVDSSKAEQDAARRLAEARNEATQAAGRQAVAGNVYSTSGANRSARVTEDKVRSAEFEVAQARKSADDARTRLRKAQDDGTANAPGAVWSPRLQQFLGLPDWQKGIRRGLQMERRDAVTEGRAFNPSEYAIVGGTEDKPLVGQVPTMKLLQVAKEGVSAQIDKLRDPLTGGLSKAGRSVWRNLKAFEEEGYRLNPAWKTANDAWSGDSSSIRALQLGKKVFSMPMEDLAEDFAAMSKNDKELFRLAAASKAIEDVRKTPLSADVSKRIINSPDELRRLSMLFDDPKEFAKFYQNINRERTMYETGGDVMRGSQTAERVIADSQHVMDLVRGLGGVALGHVKGAVHPLARAAKGFGLFDDPKMQLELAKLLTNPDVSLATRGVGDLQLGGNASEAMRRAVGGQP